MTINIESLRKMKNADFSAITEGLEKIINPQSNSYSNEEDTRMWKPTRDKAGNASAVIRFLPSIDDSSLPWVRLYSYGFQGSTGKWYINNCRSTLNEKDPCNEANYALRLTGLESDKKIAQTRGRRTAYYANIQVVNDPANPDNNGKVFIFKYGKKIFEKIAGASAKPVFEDDVVTYPFDIFEQGANFRLIMKQVDGYPNYDSSSFAAHSVLCNGDENKMVETLNQRHDLGSLITPDKFKSYEELSRQLQSVINPTLGSSPSAVEMTESYVPAVKPTSTSNYTTASTPATASSPTASTENDDILAYFAALQND